jgi:Ca2+-binding RTX toxin-like protein
LTGTLGWGGNRVRRLVFLVVVAAAVLTVAGTALAATVACNGGKCVGGDGPDSMYGSGVRDEIYSLKGEDLVRANAGGDLVNGDGGDDRLSGGRGDDTVNGSDGEDVVIGNPGNDRLSGGTGSDRIEAADGTRDAISCGNGPRDVVVFDSGLDRFPDRFSDCEILKRR